LAYSGSGKESLLSAQKYLPGGKATPEELREIAAMTSTERNEKAIEYLLDAERNSTTEMETRTVSQQLGYVYNLQAMEYAKQKDFRNAAYSVQEAVKRLDSNVVLYDNLGNYHFMAGDYHEAAAAFEKAKGLATSDELKLRIGRELVATYEKQAQSNDARAYDYAIRELDELLADRSEDVSLLWWLGRVQLAKGDIEQAVNTWEKARKLRPLDSAFEADYQRAKSTLTIKLDKQFVKDASSHFSIEFDEKSKSMAVLAPKFLDWLELAYDEVGMEYGVRPEHKVFVTIYASEEFNQAVKVPWAGGVHRENRVDIRIDSRSTEAEYRNYVFHEWTHHVVNLKAGNKPVPAWLNEGLAMRSEKKSDVIRFLGFLDQVIRKKGKYIPFEDITQTFTELASVRHVQLAYAQSYSITAKMIDRFGLGSILKILAQLATGQEFKETFQRETRVAWADFERQWFEEHRVEPDAGSTPVDDDLKSVSKSLRSVGQTPSATASSP